MAVAIEAQVRSGISMDAALEQIRQRLVITTESTMQSIRTGYYSFRRRTGTINDLKVKLDWWITLFDSWMDWVLHTDVDDMELVLKQLKDEAGPHFRVIVNTIREIQQTRP